MRLTRYTDYALRVLIHLAVQDDRMGSIGDIAKTYGISQNHPMKVASSLARAGFVTQPFDLLLDPPFGTGAGAVALDKLARQGWAAPGAWASVETGRDEKVEVKGWTIDAERVYGKAKLTLLTYSG